MTPRIVLAKYVPDISRMEPRNIGVFLWSKGEINSQFLDPTPDFVNDPATYARWVTFWQKTIQGEAIRPTRGPPVECKLPECMDALMGTQQGNYILVDSGEVLQSVGKRDLRRATEFLFKELVAPQKREAATSPSEGFKQRCDAIISPLADRNDFRRGFPIECGVFGASRTFHFNYGFGNGHPLAVMQRADLTKEASVNSAALMLHEVTARATLPRNRVAALVQRSAVHNSQAAQDAYEWLMGFCTVIDVDSDDASGRVAEVVPNGHH